MTERRGKGRPSADRRHPLRDKAKLLPAGPALERRRVSRLTVKLRNEVIERLRNAVFYTPGLTLSGFIEECIVSIVDKMEAERGSAFPVRTENLKVGRPAKREVQEAADRHKR